MLRTVLAALAAAGGCALVAPAGAQNPAQTLTIANFGGANAKAQQAAFYGPFEADQKDKGVKVRGVEYAGGLDAIRTMVQQGQPAWDVVELESADLARGCAAGHFERIERHTVAHASMLLPGTVQACGLGAFVWSTVMVFDTQRFGSKDVPRNWADFWDTQRFPGKRGLRKGVRYNLEIALLADGVHRRDVYPQLATPAGVARALKKLEQLKPHVVWWESGAQAPQRLLDGTVSMSTAFNGRVTAGSPPSAGRLSIVWTDAIYEMDYWTIVRGSPRKALALDFIRFATSENAQLAFTREIPYGPTHMGAILRYEDNRPRSTDPRESGSTHTPVVDLSMAPSDLPSAPANLRRALPFDASFWLDKGAVIERNWTAGPP